MRIFKQKSAGDRARACGMAYLSVWTLCVLWFWLGRSGGGWIMSYTILAFWFLLPVTTLITSFLLERGQDLGLRRWAAMGLFGLMYTAAIWATFSLSTLLSHARLEFPSPYYLLAGLCPSAIGIALGWVARKWNVSPRVPAIGLFLLLCVCYVQLKTFGGPLLRPVPILDVPALLLLLGTAGWLLFRRKK